MAPDLAAKVPPMRLSLLCAGLLAGAVLLPAPASALPRPAFASGASGDHRSDLVPVDDDDDCRSWRCERDDDDDGDDDDRDDD